MCNVPKNQNSSSFIQMLVLDFSSLVGIHSLWVGWTTWRPVNKAGGGEPLIRQFLVHDGFSYPILSSTYHWLLQNQQQLSYIFLFRGLSNEIPSTTSLPSKSTSINFVIQHCFSTFHVFLLTNVAMTEPTTNFVFG